MVKETKALYEQPNIREHEDVHLQTLSENCAVLEERVYAIAQNLPEGKRQVIEEYINTRNDLEVETVKVALCWGKRHLLCLKGVGQKESTCLIEDPPEQSGGSFAISVGYFRWS